MRKEFEMTEDDLNTLFEAMKPQPLMYLSGGIPMGVDPQTRANDAWIALGKRLGFDGMTVKPTGKGDRFFTAEITEEKAMEGHP
jgi:hypothetical protein